MNIQNLSKLYDIQRLNKTHIEDILEIMLHNPLYFTYCPPDPTHQSILLDMQALPPNITYDDKYYIGFYKGDSLIAILDLILHYPDHNTAFIGFFMMHEDLQGKGIGTKIMNDLLICLKEEGYQYVRLGFVKGNPQSEAFWMKNGFKRIGIEVKQELYTVVVLQKEI